MAAVTTEALRVIPSDPKAQFRSHGEVSFLGLLTMIHMKLGYARLSGRDSPPMRLARLGRNGRAIAMNEAKHPKKTRSAVRSQSGHARFAAPVYLDSRLSKAGIA